MALSNSQYNEIMRKYENRQYKNERDLQKRRQEVYTTLPAVKELDDEIASYSIAQAKARILGDRSKKGQTQKDLSLLFNKKKALLRSGGYPADYLELHYTCPDCQDTGYIGREQCHCLKKSIISLLYAQSNLQDLLSQENFDTLSMDYYSPHHIDPVTGRSSYEAMTIAVRECKSFVEHFGTDFSNILLNGNIGTGKSFLSHCIAKALMDKSYSVIYFSASQLFDHLADQAFNRSYDRYEHSEEADTRSHIYNCDLLIIDDLGTELINSFTASALFSLLNERITRKKSTVISTNLSLEDVKSMYSERIFSRITSNYTILRLTGDDIRIQKKLLDQF